MSRPFKLVIAGVASYVFADTKGIAEKHAANLATAGKTSEVRPLNDAEYGEVDFKAESFTRVPGGKADAVATPFALVFDGEVTYKLAASQAVAERYMSTLIAEKAAFSVEPVPAEEYPTIDWSSVETLEAPAKAPAKSKDDAETEGDAKDQIDMGGVPGL